MPNITIVISGGVDIQAKLKKLGSSITHLSDSMFQIGQYLARYYQDEVFASQGQALGQTWARLAPATVRDKDRAGYRRYDTVPLIRTGLMQHSFTYDTSEQSVKIGNLQDYFIYHQLGTATIPARPMEGINSPIRRYIGEIIGAEIKRKLESV